MGLRQFNVQYSLPEDRLQLRFATDDDCEYSLWLTRFITRGLIIGVGDLVARSRPDVAGEALPVAAVSPETVARRESEDAYQVPSQTPMGQIPILVTELNISAHEGNIEIIFGLMTKEHLTITLPQTTVEAMVAMLQDIQAKVGWGLSLTERPVPLVQEPVAEDKSVLH
jgi:hypothetical protein